MAFGREGAGDTGWATTVQTPHWMRLLEEKYQRLHAKIVNQAARFTTKRHSNPLLRSTTARCLKETRQASKRNITGPAKIDGERGDLNHNHSTDEVYGKEGNEAKNSDPVCVTLAKTDDAHGSLSWKAKHESVNRSKCKIRGESCESESENRVVPVENSFENEAVGLTQGTPFTSGDVTRVSSGLALTRLSSALEISQKTNEEDSSWEERAVELRLALDSHLDGERCEDNVNNNDFSGKDDVFYNDNEFVDDQNICDDEILRCHTARADMEVSKVRRQRRMKRSVKTSVSRVSHKTSKSCPATFWEDNNNNSNVTNSDENSNGVPEAVLSLTARGIHEGRMRVFARMSLEARHAIDETLKEMKSEEECLRESSSKQHARNDGWTNMNNKEKHRDMHYDNGSVVNNTSGQGIDERVEEEDEGGSSAGLESEISIPSNEKSSNNPNNFYAPKQHLENNNHQSFSHTKNHPNYLTTSRATNSNVKKSFNTLEGTKSTAHRLPHLSKTQLNTGDFPSPHARLPGIGKMLKPASFRENTFEITPPDFDIRFHHIISCSTGERETPPLDIRQQSIEKCQQWLVRHTPKH